MTDPKVDRLANAALTISKIYNDQRMGDGDGWYEEFQELYNSARAVTGEECEHDWFPNAARVGGRLFTTCGKCGLERSPDDPGIQIRQK